MANKQVVPLADAFERVLGEIRTRVCVFTGTDGAAAPPAALAYTPSLLEPEAPPHPAIAIAYSGGLDSSALLHLAHAYVARHGGALFAFHIHHGLSPHADDWLTHCRRECARLDVAFVARHVTPAQTGGSGVEEAARVSRYAALGDLCRRHQVPLLLTAHHQDDQAETVLLQLMRGSGVAGLSGMEVANAAPDLLGAATPVMGRPLLGVSRAGLADYVRAQEIAYVEDESNSDTRYARNALRHQVMPALADSFPGFQQRFARTAQHAQSAQRLLVELAAQDFAQCRDGDCLDLRQLKGLGADRADNLLRYWFGLRGMRMPSTAWLCEMRTQLLEAKADAQLCVTHADCHIRRHRDRVFLTPRLAEDGVEVLPQAFRWNGQAELPFAAYHGVLHFEAAEQGVAADWLRDSDLLIHYRQGGERLKPAANRPTRSLKYHYQALDIPAWERERLPLLSSGKQLLFAAGIGMDCHRLADGPGRRIRFRWKPD